MFLGKSAALVAEFCGAPDPQIVIEPRHNIAPGQKIVVCDNTGVLSEKRWGVILVRRANARGRPVMGTIVNVRSETIFDKMAFLGVSRCLAPASGWYEWTGRRRTKTAWRISMAGQR